MSIDQNFPWQDGFSEDVRKFLIEYELGRRIAKLLLAEFKA
jgi:hypothetical protein